MGRQWAGLGYGVGAGVVGAAPAGLDGSANVAGVPSDGIAVATVDVGDDAPPQAYSGSKGAPFTSSA